MVTLSAMLRRIEAAERVFWFIDFDGTLVAIRKDPDKVVLGEPARKALARISSRKDARVAVVSGRPLAYVQRQIDLPRVVCAGNHGLEIRGNKIRYGHPDAAAARPLLLRVREAWDALLPRFHGALVEDKNLCVTFHYRKVVGSRAAQARLQAEKAARRIGEGNALRLTRGKKVVEVRPPVQWGKGEALRYLLGRWGHCPGKDLAVVIGDDETDRDMFAPVQSSGLTLFVGRTGVPKEANGRLRGPSAVRNLLERAALLPG
jgi:trehalose 6-phosphate phosphatase